MKMHQKFIWLVSLFIGLSAGCATPPAKTVKDPKCRAEIHQLQARENVNLKVSPDDGLRMKEVGTEIDKYMPSVRKCYENSSLARTVEEKLEIRFGFLIRKDGSVSRTCIEETQIDEVELQACLAQVLRGIRFPTPRGGSAVAISFPFTFETHTR